MIPVVVDELGQMHAFCRQINPRPPLTETWLQQIDPGIVGAVLVLHDHGIETCQSCEGGPGHSYPYPTVDFIGGPAAGFAAVSIAVQHGLRPRALSHHWPIQGDDLDAPVWRLEFRLPFAPGTYEPESRS